MASNSFSAAELFDVKDMVFFITGAGSGLGKTMAHALDENGAAKVYIMGRRMDKLEEVAKTAKNGSIIPIKGDATSSNDLAAAATKVRSEVGYVNVVIANSGIIGPNLEGLSKDKPSISEIQDFFFKVPQEKFTETFAVNDTAMFYTLIAFLDLLDQGNKDGKSPTKAMGIKSQFIATSSIAGLHRSPLAGFAYSGSKAGCIHMVKNLATYLAPHKIRANTIAPGLYPSEMNTKVTRVGKSTAVVMSIANMWLKDSTKEGAVESSIVPLQRSGTEQEMAAAILTLCGKGGGYYDGFVLVTDGGRVGILPGTY